MLGVQGLQLQKMGDGGCSGGGTFAIPNDSDTIVVSHSDDELGHAMMSSNHFVMGHSSHKLKITVSDCSLGVGESDWGILCPLFARLMPWIRAIMGPFWH